LQVDAALPAPCRSELELGVFETCPRARPSTVDAPAHRDNVGQAGVQADMFATVETKRYAEFWA
jgi:hypothetical protein